jgi:hypothetical protein
MMGCAVPRMAASVTVSGELAAAGSQLAPDNNQTKCQRQ